MRETNKGRQTIHIHIDNSYLKKKAYIHKETHSHLHQQKQTHIQNKQKT